MTDAMRIGRNIGAAIGAVVFLVFGLVPGFYFGSYGVLVSLQRLFGHSVEPNILVRMLIVAGVVLGIFCTAAVSIVLGSVFGTVVGYLTEVFAAPVKEKAEVGVESK